MGVSERMSAESKPIEELRGVIEDVVYRNDANDYAVLEIADDKQQLITAVGTVPGATEGEFVILHGTYVYHKEYGKQFSIVSCEKSLPTGTDDILKYLSSRSVKGVGPVTALKIVNKYGEATLDVIENHPEWLADIPGITMKKAAQIAASFKEQIGLYHLMVFGRDFMDNAKIAKVYKAFGVGAVGKIKENPYILCDSRCGLSFEKADEIAKSLLFSADNEERIFQGLRYVLRYNAVLNGHTCLPYDRLCAAAQSLLDLPNPTVSGALDSFLAQNRLAVFVSAKERYVMTKEIRLAEECISAKLAELQMNAVSYDSADVLSMIEKVETSAGIEYAPLQRKALFEAMKNGVMILTGGPGTGKTTVVKAMLSVFRSLHVKCVLCAPTGRAAKRMSEATSEEAKTIHRMLEMEKTAEGSDEEIRFNRNERNPLEEKVVIVDEASMVDLTLMEALARALPRHAKLIMIGDSHQLPSVGGGNVLGDFIASGMLPTVCLTDIFRQSQSSNIVLNAHLIHEGKMPVLTATDGDFFFVGRSNDDDIAATVVNLVTERLPRAYGKDIVRTLQVITPSRKGSGGVERLNLLLQEKLNPPGPFKNEKISHGVTFREGDRVMQVANNYDIEWEKNGFMGTGLFNGDIGVINKINNQDHTMRICFDERETSYGFDLLDDLEPAYAITVHKSQGSEYPVVIVPMYGCPPMLRTRNLLYTAVTRAKKMVILVGRKDIVANMVENNREILRYTTLKERLISCLGE